MVYIRRILSHADYDEKDWQMMIGVPEKYALEVSSPTPIASERQHEQYLSVLDKLSSKDNPTSDEEKYAEVLMTLIEAYEEEHHSVPDASPVGVLRTLMDANDLRQKDLGACSPLR